MSQVTVVSTPDNGSCGIGTYTGELISTLPTEVTVRWLTVPLGSMNPLPYVAAAVRAGTTDDPTIHVQHEYLIYGPRSIWSWLFFLILFILTMIRGRQVIVTFHSAWNQETIGPPLVSIKQLYVSMNNRLLAATADQAVFLSDNTAAAFQQDMQHESVETLPHGVQTNVRSMSKKTAKQELGYEPDRQLVVLPGYIRPAKGCEIFVTLAKQFDTPFILAGGCHKNPNYCAQLQEYAPENINITGKLDEATFHAAFAAADLIVLPYLKATQSGVFNLSVAHGVPVIGSDIPYFQSLADKWDCLAVTNTDDIDATVDLVEQLLTNDEHRTALIDAMEEYREAASMESVGTRHAMLYDAAGESGS